MKTNFWEIRFLNLDVILCIFLVAKAYYYVTFFGGRSLFTFFFVLYVCTNKGKITQGGNPVVLPYGAEVPVLPGPPVGHHEGCHTAHQVVDCRGLEVQLPIHDPSGWVDPD